MAPAGTAGSHRTACATGGPSETTRALLYLKAPVGHFFLSTENDRVRASKNVMNCTTGVYDG